MGALSPMGTCERPIQTLLAIALLALTEEDLSPMQTPRNGIPDR